MSLIDYNKKGYFITLEGGECTGKGTQIKLLTESLRKWFPDRQVIDIVDPGSTYIGQEIRRLVKNIQGMNAPTKFCELFLFSAARVQMVEKIIKPNLEKGNIIISDRFIDSTTVYQGRMNKNSMEDINKINELIDCYPDLTFVLDIDEETFIERMAKREGVEQDRYDCKSLDFHKRVFEEYRTLVQEEEESGNNRDIFLINSEDTPERVNDIMVETVEMLHGHNCII